MGKVLTEFEVLRYASILEVFMEVKFGSYADMLLAYKDKKEGKPVLMSMYEAMVYEEQHGLDSLDEWYYSNVEYKAKVDQVIVRAEKQRDSVELLKDFPLMVSCKFLQKHLPAPNLLVRHTTYMYDKLQRLSNKIRFPKGTKIGGQHDPVIAKDGFYSWEDYLAYELERIRGVED
ncbi:hypothetical protein HOS33_gp218 [Erwinia phage vB_EamM_Y3]|uniref:Uncharacterized protein n=1 Tax=Erwinia phage vB_EamM_Y3 TaxID=1983553 RepID=A0A2H4IBC9_9CAUD|nr:hypothetical protein HOS33_gp218 [Erwinia phage vB_EamM_Y3]ARW58858.1 hypothetical protein Y3_218 [Erwinia phage vB_EamM_Y3]